VQTDSIRLNFQFNNRLGVNATIKGFVVDGFDSLMGQPLARNRNINFAKTIFVHLQSLSLSLIGWKPKWNPVTFNVNDQTKIGIPDIQPSYVLTVQSKYRGEILIFQEQLNINSQIL
jgi:hypothetical protein